MKTIILALGIIFLMFAAFNLVVAMLLAVAPFCAFAICLLVGLCLCAGASDLDKKQQRVELKDSAETISQN